MKSVPLHVVKYFKGEETRTLSKHLDQTPALQVAQRFISRLQEKKTQTGDEHTLVTHTEQGLTTIRLRNETTQEVLDEGVVVSLDAQKDPNWDYPQYSDSCTTGSGHVATVNGHQGWPFTLVPQ